MIIGGRPAPKDIHVPTPTTWKYIILHGTRDFEDVIWIEFFEIGRVS